MLMPYSHRSPGSKTNGRRSEASLAVVVDGVPADDGALGMALLEDVSPHGARLLMEAPVEPGRTVSYEVPGTQFSGSGTVVFNRALESPLRVRFVVGLAGQRKPRFAWRFPWSTGGAELKPVA